MTELSKVFSSLLLLGAGFFAASLFGPPDLAERIAQRLRPASGESTSWLEPAPSSGPPLRDPTQAAAPLPPLPQTPPVAPYPSTASSAPAATLTATPAPATSAPAAVGEANAWLKADRGWATPSAPNTPTPAAVASAGWPERAPAPAPQPPTTQAVPAAWGQAVPESSGQAVEASWGEPWGVTPAAAASDWPQQPRAAAKPVVPTAPREPQRLGTHVVTDGDTLASLAERYLGTSGRAAELFELNTDRLESPDLLPIGVVLRVPDEGRRSAPAASTRPPTPTLTAPPLAPVSPHQGESSFAPIGYPSAPQAAPQRMAPPSRASPRPALQHQESRLMPVGDPIEPAAPMPTVGLGAGEPRAPVTIDEWSW